MDWSAEVDDILAAAVTAGGLEATLATGAFGELTVDTVRSIVAEAARFAGEVLAPINHAGDREGSRLAAGRVTTAPGLADAYRRWRDGGWSTIGAPTAWGGQAMPVVVHVAVQEIWNAANPSFAVGPMLTAGAVEALAAHADADLQSRLLPDLVSGTWTATMNLTEPQAGSDLGGIKTRAERHADGTYRLFGQKIFITYGDHDLTENIVHLVLARVPDAPAGTKGISLFAVPKILPDGMRNDVTAVGLEHKLGMHASPTCTMAYGERGGAVGWRVGGENRGLAAMFTMMNIARLSVGVQGVGIAAAATAKAAVYAGERRQGRAIGATGASSPIGDHPDVRRMLASMRTLTSASRLLCHAAAHAIDMSRVAIETDRASWTDRAALLTPIAKAFPTDAAIAVADLGIQVHGGAGYIEETGAAQFLRDARVFAIYEGTNGIQAIDLVTRKLPLGNGAAIAAVIDEVRGVAGRAAAVNAPTFGRTAERLNRAADDWARSTRYLQNALAEGRLADALAAATPYLRLAALAFGGSLLANAALTQNADADRRTAARFFAETFAGETTHLAEVVSAGATILAET